MLQISSSSIYFLSTFLPLLPSCPRGPNFFSLFPPSSPAAAQQMRVAGEARLYLRRAPGPRAPPDVDLPHRARPTEVHLEGEEGDSPV